MKSILILCVFLWPVILVGQLQVDRSVFSALGDSGSGAMSVNSTIGESNIGLGNGGTVKVTVGFQQVFDFVLASNEVKETPFSYFPNPAHHFLQIKWEEGINEVQLLNLEGVVVQSFSGMKEGSRQIRLNHLPAGYYFIQVQSPTGKLKKGKLIVY